MFKLVEKCVSYKYARPVVITQCLCNYSKNLDKETLREVHRKNENLPSPETATTSLTEAKKESTDVANESDLQWRTPWHEKEGEHYSYLRVFQNEDSKRNILQIMESPINWSSIQKWLRNTYEKRETMMQSYLSERHDMLGNELAAAHFIVYRGGAIKFFDEDVWIKEDENKKYTLPSYYEPKKTLQGIDCSYMDLRYEGLENITGLRKLEWLSLNGCRYIDDWCLDKISNIFSHSLIYLDLRDCPNITERGLGALYKMGNLKILLLDDLWKDTIYELTCLLLQETNPNLDIRSK